MWNKAFWGGCGGKVGKWKGEVVEGRRRKGRTGEIQLHCILIPCWALCPTQELDSALVQEPPLNTAALLWSYFPSSKSPSLKCQLGCTECCGSHFWHHGCSILQAAQDWAISPQSYPTFQHWGSHANKACAASCTGHRSLLNISECLLGMWLHQYGNRIGPSECFNCQNNPQCKPKL